MVVGWQVFQAVNRQIDLVFQQRDLESFREQALTTNLGQGTRLRVSFGFDLNQLDYYISFWDENTDRPPKPYVALATVKDGKIVHEQFFYDMGDCE